MVLAALLLSSQLGAELLWSWQVLQCCHANSSCQFLMDIVHSLGLLHPFVKMPFNGRGITKLEIFNLFTPQAIWLLGLRREKFSFCCAAAMRNVVILWLQYLNTDAWSPFRFVRPLLEAVSRTRGQWGSIPNAFCWCWPFQAAGPSSADVQYSCVCSVLWSRIFLSPFTHPKTTVWLAVSYVVQLHPAKPFHMVWASRQATSVVLPFYLHFIFIFPDRVLLRKRVVWRGWDGGQLFSEASL